MPPVESLDSAILLRRNRLYGDRDHHEDGSSRDQASNTFKPDPVQVRQGISNLLKGKPTTRHPESKVHPHTLHPLSSSFSFATTSSTLPSTFAFSCGVILRIT